MYFLDGKVCKGSFLRYSTCDIDVVSYTLLSRLSDC